MKENTLDLKGAIITLVDENGNEIPNGSLFKKDESDNEVFNADDMVKVSGTFDGFYLSENSSTIHIKFVAEGETRKCKTCSLFGKCRFKTYSDSLVCAEYEPKE